ncbi:hypothetical protein PG997_005635 [Apiospora hydei]|uniref:Uncharacterized protein n=1 Tax=Apiospora hydei TaxID=1337664 RepID=A0ABR1WQK7_9PEZI
MASSSPTKSPGVLALNDETLTDLREKFLSVFGVASLLIDKKLPRIHLQHDLLDLGEPYANMGPIPDNDFHVVADIIYDEAAWSASLRIETTEHGAKLVPLNIKHEHWSERGILGAGRAGGVPLFQMLVWSQVDTWYNGWEACINDLDDVLEVNVTYPYPSFWPISGPRLTP